MPVDSKHPEYDKYFVDWEGIKDFIEGERKVKEGGPKYTPPLKEHESNRQAYATYVDFGELFNGVGRTLVGFTGATMRKAPMVEYGSDQGIAEHLEHISNDGKSLDIIIREVCNEALSVGRVGLLVDADNDGNPYIATYNSTAIINWNDDGSRVVLYEYISEPDPNDEFESIIKDQIRILGLDEAGLYYVRIFQKERENNGIEDWFEIELAPAQAMPSIRGKRLDYIPFVIIGSEDNSLSVDKPPLLDVFYLNMAHWRKSVDFNYALHLIGLPTPIFLGFDEQVEKGIFLGPGSALTSGDTNASASFLEFKGAGLHQIKEAMDTTVVNMSVSGAKMLEPQRSRVETAETARIHQSANTTVLSGVVSNIEDGMNTVLMYYSDWLGMGEITVEMNRDFVDVTIDPQMITTLLNALQAGRISVDTFIWNLKQGEVLPDDRTIDDEIDLIENDRKNNPVYAGLSGGILSPGNQADQVDLTTT